MEADGPYQLRAATEQIFVIFPDVQDSRMKQLLLQAQLHQPEKLTFVRTGSWE